MGRLADKIQELKQDEKVDELITEIGTVKREIQRLGVIKGQVQDKVTALIAKVDSFPIADQDDKDQAGHLQTLLDNALSS